MQIGNAPIGVGWLLGLLVLVVAVVFAFIGVPDPRAVLLLIGVLALARLLL